MMSDEHESETAVSFDGEYVLDIDYKDERYTVELGEENVIVTKGHQEVTLTLKNVIEIFMVNVAKLFDHDDEQE